MTSPPPRCQEDRCITCSDDGTPMHVVTVGEAGLAVCRDANGARHVVEVALVEPVACGDDLLVHAGTALARLGEPR